MILKDEDPGFTSRSGPLCDNIPSFGDGQVKSSVFLETGNRKPETGNRNRLSPCGTYILANGFFKKRFFQVI